MTDKRDEALDLIREMIPSWLEDSRAATFGTELGDLSLDNVFGALWTRPGLTRRDRSLVTLGILIALRATDELHYHFPIALRNGLSPEEIAEVIYHASGYAGFPAASSARSVAQAVLGTPAE